MNHWREWLLAMDDLDEMCPAGARPVLTPMVETAEGVIG